jgi:hypothetical protein
MKQQGRSARSLVAVSVFLSVAAEEAHSSHASGDRHDGRLHRGPAVDRDGNVYFTDIINQRIMKLDADGVLSIYRENRMSPTGS